MSLSAVTQGTDNSPNPPNARSAFEPAISSQPLVEDTSLADEDVQDVNGSHRNDVPSTMVSNEHGNGVTTEEGVPVLEPPFTGAMAKRASQLPTPQSPNNIGTYTNPFGYGAESPSDKARHNPRPTRLEQKSRTPPNGSEIVLQPRSLLMTPDLSPVFLPRTKSSLSSSSSPAAPSRASLRPDRRPFATPPPRPSSLPHVQQDTPHSGLSSPFVESSQRRGSAKSTPRRSATNSPIVFDDTVFSPPSSSVAPTPPPLVAPVPERVVSGEISTMRLQIVADQASRLADAEARRPDYLKRTKRSPSEPRDVVFGDQENTHPALGVIDSPVKGRRIALFQETSEESFEQSLLAGGYPSYGRTLAYVEPSIPAQNGKLVHSVHDRHPDGTVNDQETTKQRRLAAFRDHNTIDKPRKLYIVTVAGMGRVLSDHIPDGSDEVLKKRAGRKRKGPVLESPTKKVPAGHARRPADSPVEATKPNWPDDAFPWSLRSQQRQEYAKKQEEERLRQIEHYLDRDSDEDDDNEDQSLGLLPIEELLTPKRGRGKMVPLSRPGHPKNSKQSKVMIPSDPADARAALLSKRTVRAMASRRQEKEREGMCICNGKGRGREQVQCDDCHKWFHLRCIGVDIAELGREEDPWYCNDCLGISKHTQSSPTFVPTDDRLPINGNQRDLFFPLPVQQESPGPSWGTPVHSPKTPTRSSDLTRSHSSRSSMGGSSQIGPHTPSSSAHSVRIYKTPGPAPFLDTLDEPFDPTSTPSRGMKFSGPFTTPKAPMMWGYRSSGSLLQTPSRSLGRTGSLPFPSSDPHDASSPSRTVYENDDSPVRRSATKSTALRRAPDSPLAHHRPAAFPVFGPLPPASAIRRNSADKLSSGSAAV